MLTTTHPFPLQLPAKTWMTAALVIGLAVSGWSLFLALSQPYLGLNLTLGDNDQITVKSAHGPSQHIPPGTPIVALKNAQSHFALRPSDLITEPDGLMANYAEYDLFLSRQNQLAQFQKSPTLDLLTPDGSTFTIRPLIAGRPLTSLPPDFWVQIIVGLLAWMVSASVFIFRPAQQNARYLLLSGAATLVFTTAAASYTTRELGFDGTTFRWACDINFLGGSLFTASFVALLLYYPRRLAPRWAGLAIVALFTIWFILQQVGIFQSMTFARRFLVMLGVLATFILAGIQWWATRKEPLARASLQWFLLSWLLGTSLFATFILLPQMFGVDTSAVQGYAFSLFLLVYGGLAFGILRFRLFDIGDWWRGILTWTGAVLFLVLLDMLFLYGLQLSTEMSLSLALLISGLLWLPLRGWLWTLITRRKKKGFRSHFDNLMQIAVSSAEDSDPNPKWTALLKKEFSALEATPLDTPPPHVSLDRNGLDLLLPGLPGQPAIRLTHASEGRRLFNQRDVAEASEMRTMLLHILDSLDSYRKGILEERKRIARDLHDNTMGNLLSALHQGEIDSKDDHIRSSIRELRQIINNHPVETENATRFFESLEQECRERSRANGLTLTWDNSLQPAPDLSRVQIHALASIIREALTNTFKHARANRVSIHLSRDSSNLLLTIKDDGQGLPDFSLRSGHGLENMESRLTELGGSLACPSSDKGTALQASLPLNLKDQ